MLNTRDRISTLRIIGRTPRPKLQLRSPRIRMVTPKTNFSVSADVLVLIDAVSDHEPIGNLRVEIQIDRTTLISAKYSLLSGYYGAIWDCSGERAGTTHTLIAKVVDSNGNSKSTLTTVSVG